MDVMMVKMPLANIFLLAERLGSQEVYVCPTDDHVCWRHRDLVPYAEEPDECVECFLAWILRGE